MGTVQVPAPRATPRHPLLDLGQLASNPAFDKDFDLTPGRATPAPTAHPNRHTPTKMAYRPRYGLHSADSSNYTCLHRLRHCGQDVDSSVETSKQVAPAFLLPDTSCTWLCRAQCILSCSINEAGFGRGSAQITVTTGCAYNMLHRQMRCTSRGRRICMCGAGRTSAQTHIYAHSFWS